jgi:uncharacterized protein YndB with AHSA1/START domain
VKNNLSLCPNPPFPFVIGKINAMKTETRTLHHTVTFNASPAEVYKAFMDSRQHAAFTGMKAKIVAKEGGKFAVCGPNNFGVSLVLEPGRRIVQAWAHRDLPEGHYTIIDLQLKKKGKKTVLEFYQYATPASAYGWLDKGWYVAYWNKMNVYFDAK